MDVIIKTKFNVGDKLYTFIPYQDCERKKCDACNGKGHVIIKGNSFACDKCYGRGKIDKIVEKHDYKIRVINIATVDIRKTIGKSKMVPAAGYNEPFERVIYGVYRTTLMKNNKESKLNEAYYLSENDILNNENIYTDLTTIENKINELKKKQ